MSKQDNFYLNYESDAFFDRNNIGKSNPKELRPSKKEILYTLLTHKDISNSNVLEIGCFIGDLLFILKNQYNCNVTGIEPSKKACHFSKSKYNLLIENATLTKSSLFNFNITNKAVYDVIICDDILSWIDKSLILPCLSVIDWLLADNGMLFIRDFCPSFSFAFRNHHCKTEEIFNNKQQRGHKSFFINTGTYLETYSLIRQDLKYQKIHTTKRDSTIWSDTILNKITSSVHPKLNL